MAEMAGPVGGVDYPVAIQVDPYYGERNRLTVAFRLILAIPHLILVGGIGWSAYSLGWWWGDNGRWELFGGNGVLGAVAGVCALIAWFAIVFTGKHPRGLWDLAHFYLRWRVRALAYTALFRDEYPPFGDAQYPAFLTAEYPEGPRDRLSVGLRIFYAIPHLIIVAVLSLAWSITSLIAWFAILFTGNYPRGLYDFGMGVMRWSIRVEAYMLLILDQYPPFSLD